MPFFFVKFRKLVAYLRGKITNSKSFSKIHNTLRLLGCSQEDVAQYIGWQSGEMASLLPGV